MQRYFVKEDNWSSYTIMITGEDVHHIVRVMRMGPGDKVVCIHPDQRIALCEITKVEQDIVHCKIDKWINENRELPVKVTIVQSLGKGDKLEQVVQKGTELGAYNFVPYQAERSIVKWDEKKVTKKVQRLQKIAKEASEQSERSHIPEVFFLKSHKELLQWSEEFHLKMFAYEDEAKQKDYQALGSVLQKVEPGTRILVVFGPEGGFSDTEVDNFYKHHFHSVRLGPRILRMETAPLYFLSSLSFQFEELR